MKTAGVQYYNTHQELILSNIVTKNNIYNNYSYASCVNWEIEKTPETNPKELEFDINKPGTDLKKVDFNINVIDNGIDDMKDKKVAHPSDSLSNDNFSNIKDHKIQQV